MSVLKTSLRKKFINDRFGIKDQIGRSVNILNVLKLNNKFISAKTILFYYGVDGEVRTDGLIKELLENGSKEIYLPFIKSQEIGLIKSLSDIDFKKNEIPIPKQISKIPKKLDLIIVPGVVFCHSGNRIGRGGGWYDKFLSKYCNSSYKLGLTFDECIIDEIDPEDHDVLMDMVISG